MTCSGGLPPRLEAELCGGVHYSPTRSAVRYSPADKIDLDPPVISSRHAEKVCVCARKIIAFSQIWRPRRATRKISIISRDSFQVCLIPLIV